MGVSQLRAGSDAAPNGIPPRGENLYAPLRSTWTSNRCGRTSAIPITTLMWRSEKVLQRHGFTWQQGSVYFGGENINAVTCVLAAIDVSAQLKWFAASVRAIRMLRIEELNDLMPAVRQALGR